jgi:acyl-coenzyme A synthetase/AMP-(fatty) acid ligase
VEHTLVLDRLGKAAKLIRPGRGEALWGDAMRGAGDECPVEWMEAEAPAFLLGII